MDKGTIPQETNNQTATNFTMNPFEWHHDASQRVYHCMPTYANQNTPVHINPSNFNEGTQQNVQMYTGFAEPPPLAQNYHVGRDMSTAYPPNSGMLYQRDHRLPNCDNWNEFSTNNTQTWDSTHHPAQTDMNRLSETGAPSDYQQTSRETTEMANGFSNPANIPAHSSTAGLPYQQQYSNALPLPAGFPTITPENAPLPDLTTDDPLPLEPQMNREPVGGIVARATRRTSQEIREDQELFEEFFFVTPNSTHDDSIEIVFEGRAAANNPVQGPVVQENRVNEQMGINLPQNENPIDTDDDSVQFLYVTRATANVPVQESEVPQNSIAL